jgi:hypothetical protein
VPLTPKRPALEMNGSRRAEVRCHVADAASAAQVPEHDREPDTATPTPPFAITETRPRPAPAAEYPGHPDPLGTDVCSTAAHVFLPVAAPSPIRLFMTPTVGGPGWSMVSVRGILIAAIKRGSKSGSLPDSSNAATAKDLTRSIPNSAIPGSQASTHLVLKSSGS